MMFRDKSISKFYAVALATVFAMTLAGCGGGGTAADDDDPAVTPTPQEMCEDEGGRWNADLTCTTAEELEAERMAAVAAVTAEAGTMGDAIAAEVAQTTDAGLGGTGATTYSIAFNRDREGTTITIADTAMASDDDPKFMQDMALGDGTALVRDNGEGVEEVVIVRTDIEAPTATAFAEVADQALNVDTDAVATTFEALTVDSVTAFAELQSAGFTAASGANVTILNLAHDDTGTTDVDEAFEIAGAYNGAMGTYRCNQTSGNCTVTVDADSKVTAVSVGWIFTPDEGVTSDVPDADYLHYGVWLQRTTTDGATTIDEVETFSGSTIAPSTGTEVNDVEGSASYEGGAVGVYVKDAYKSDGTLDSATSGAFTADASLMVYFGGNDVAVNLKNTVTGSISNFELSGGEDNAWSVALSGTRILDANEITGSANGGGAAGAFSGTFRGLTGITADATDSATNRDMPDDITGEFNANFSNGAVAGGFGASKQ